MDDVSLISLLEDLESDRVERKASASDHKKIRQAICAFANDMPGHGNPGVLFIGAHDDGSCADLKITDELLTLLAGMRDDGSILPFPNMRVRKRVLKGCELAVVEVEPSQDPPVRYKNRTWIRVGPVAVDLTSGEKEERRPDYPLEALRQLVRNAVLHRNYEGTSAPVRINWFRDRIEIQNPGGPYGQVTPENFGTPGITDYRNPHLAEILKYLGFVQRFGVGLQVVRDALEKNGNPPVEFDVQQSHVMVTVRRVA